MSRYRYSHRRSTRPLSPIAVWMMLGLPALAFAGCVTCVCWFDSGAEKGAEEARRKKEEEQRLHDEAEATKHAKEDGACAAWVADAGYDPERRVSWCPKNAYLDHPECFCDQETSLPKYRNTGAEADRRRKALHERLAAEEANRTPAQRAALALAELDHVKTGDGHMHVCRAKRMLDKIPESARAATDVAKAFAALKTAEATELQLERADVEKSRAVVCADGSLSDCLCAGSHKGCCSHHGGIAGCAPLPTSVACK